MVLKSLTQELWQNTCYLQLGRMNDSFYNSYLQLGGMNKTIFNQQFNACCPKLG